MHVGLQRQHRQRSQTSESRGLVALAQGFSAVYEDDDQAQLAAELPVYDALYAWCRRQEGQSVLR